MYSPKKVTEKLEAFDTISFKEFVDELKKQKVKLSASQQMDLLTLFDEQKSAINSISTQIAVVQASLDDLVFAIYQIPHDVAEQIKASMQIVL